MAADLELAVPRPDYARNHPWQVVGLLALYEIAVFIRWFVTEVWKKVGGTLIDFCADRLKLAALTFVSGCEKDYRQHVFYHCRDFDVKGLTTQGIYSLEMKRVFVELSIAPHQADKRGHDPIPPPSGTEAAAERRDIWEYLEKPGHFAIIGAPGSGKTTLLRHVAISLAFSRRKKIDQTLPVLLYLRSHAKALAENPDLSLQDVILASEVVKEQTVKPPQNWFEQKLNKGKCLILLDGLDEVGDAATRMKVVAWVEKRMRTHANNRFFIASRPLGYQENPVPGVTTLRVLPLSPDQVGRFVSNWYLANEVMSHNKEDEGVRIEARKGAADLMSRIRSSDVLTDLVVNPLLLTMIATVHRFRSQLPGRRVELYREICEVFLGKRQAVKGVRDEIDLTPDQKRFVLQSLAYRLMSTKEREIAVGDAATVIESSLKSVSPNTRAPDFLKMVESTSGLLWSASQGSIRLLTRPSRNTWQPYTYGPIVWNKNWQPGPKTSGGTKPSGCTWRKPT